MPEQVDILIPPSFKKSGIIKPRNQAWTDGDWIGTFNLWIVQDQPESAIIYQMRSAKSSWVPNKLDVTAGGYYQAGEGIVDGIREVEEELGKTYNFKDLTHLGRKLHVSPDERGHTRHNVVDIFVIRDNSPLDTYQLESREVHAIVTCPINKLIKVHTQPKYSFTTKGLDNQGKTITIKVTKDSFPYNWDNYHFKIALIAKRFIAGESNLIY